MTFLYIYLISAVISYGLFRLMCYLYNQDMSKDGGLIKDSRRISLIPILNKIAALVFIALALGTLFLPSIKISLKDKL